MAYIGKTPQTGAYSILDSLTASATASYTMQLNSVNYLPESAQHLIVSLNGSIQKPNSSFSCSGSTLTFSEALTSSDSIDFIYALGNVLDVGTVSDATITNAKTNFVSTSSASGLQIKGDGTTDGTLQLNCSQNSHGIKLKSPPHSASASYTLTFPNDDGTSGQALTTNGSGVLTWASGGETNVPAFFAYTPNSYQAISTATWTSPNLTNELFDTANAFNTSDKKFTPQVAGKYMFFGNIGTDGNWSTLARLRISKNDNSAGGDEVRNVNIVTNSEGVHVSGMLTLNGSSDYVRMQVYHENGGNVNMINAGFLNYFGGFLVTTT